MMSGYAIEAARQTTSSEPDQTFAPVVWQAPVAGVNIDEHVALTSSAVWGSVRVISDAIMCLPVGVIMPRSDGGRDPVPDDPVNRLLDVPNEEMDWGTYAQTETAHCMTWGNSYSEIEVMTGSGAPAALWPIEPNRVNPDRDRAGNLIYDVHNPREANTVLSPRRMLHTKGLGYDGVIGYSVVRMAKEAISLGLAAESYGAGLFGNGAMPGGVLEHPGRMSDEAMKRLRGSWERMHGGPRNAKRTAILEQGITYKALSIPPEDAQFLETRTFQVREIGPRWFGVPPPFLGDLADATYSNVEQLFIVLVNQGIMPWAKRFETQLSFKLFHMRGQRQQVKINVNGLLRGDLRARAEFYKSMRDLGVLSINEIRALEDLNEIDGGELRLVPMNMRTVEEANRGENVTGSSGGVPDGLLEPVVADAAARIAHKEANALKTANRKGDEYVKNWAGRWFRDGKHVAMIQETLRASLELAKRLTGTDYTEAATSWVMRHIERAERDVLEAADEDAVDLILEGWVESRSDIIASAIMEALTC